MLIHCEPVYRGGGGAQGESGIILSYNEPIDETWHWRQMHADYAFRQVAAWSTIADVNCDVPADEQTAKHNWDTYRSVRV